MQSRRGLASIITSAILLTTVVLLGTGVVVWGNTSLSSNQSQFNDAYSKNVNKINENVLFEKIWFGGSAPNFINITMNNQSPAGVNVTKIQLSSASGTIQCPVNYKVILSKQEGSMQSSPCSYSDNILTTVQITTSRGSVFSTEVFPP